jgi:hypothetical protein
MDEKYITHKNMIHIVRPKTGVTSNQKEVIGLKNLQHPFSLIQERHKN